MVVELLRLITYTELTTFNQGAAMVKNGVWEVNQVGSELPELI